MPYLINYNTYSSIFAVPSQIADHCLVTCSGVALKVLLLVLRSPDAEIQISSIAKSLGYPAGDVKEALDYWTKENILRIPDAQQADCPPAQIIAQPEPLVPQAAPQQLNQPAAVPAIQNTVSPEKVKQISAAAKKNMTISEIEILSHTDSKINDLLDALQSVIGRPLGRGETETILSYYTYAGLPPEYILLVTAHCVSINLTNMKSISKTLDSMVSEGIDTYDKAESYINRWAQRKTCESQVKSAFGIYDRALTTKEKKFIDYWFNTLGFDISMVKLAYERTIDQITTLSFSYINGILISWYNSGITTTKEAADESSSRSLSSAKAAEKNSSIDMNELQHFITYGSPSNTNNIN